MLLWTALFCADLTSWSTSEWAETDSHNWRLSLHWQGSTFTQSSSAAFTIYV